MEASLDFISPTTSEGIYTGGISATSKLTVVSWNTMVLYPAGSTSDALTYEATPASPDGSLHSLSVASQAANEIKFKPVSLTMLVDPQSSPATI